MAATPTPVAAGYVRYYSNRIPYLTAEEFIAAGTGADTSQIIPGGTPGTQRDALTSLISRASSEADAYCNQILAATIDTQTAPPAGWRPRRRGGAVVIEVPVDNTPIVSVNAVRLSTSPVARQVEFTDLTGVYISRKTVTVPVNGAYTAPAGTTGGSPWPGSAGDAYWGGVDYVNGFHNAFLAATANPGDTTITLTDVLGLFPGVMLTAYDTLYSRTETFNVADTYIPGQTTVPIDRPIGSVHKPGVQVAALPPVIRDAVISLTSSLIKRRGGESIVLASINEEPGRTTAGEDGMSEDEAHAYAILEGFRRVR